MFSRVNNHTLRKHYIEKRISIYKMKDYQGLVAWDKKYTNRPQNKPSVKEFILLPHVTSFLKSISEKPSFFIF